MHMTMRLLVFFFTIYFIHGNGLYGTFLVRMKVDRSPRSVGASTNELNFIRRKGMESLEKLEKILKLNLDKEDKTLIGPRASRSPRVKNYERYWFINSARIVMRVDLANELSKSSAVAEVVKDEPIYVERGVSKELGYSPEFTDLGLPEIHRSDLMGQGIRIGIIDTGLFEHREFDNKVVAYKDFTKSPSELMRDKLGHGSHVAGLLVGGDDSGEQIGVVPKANIIVAKVIEPVSAEGEAQVVQTRLKTFASRVLNAMQWLLDPDGDPNTEDYPHVINNSWSFPVAAPISKNFFDRALARWRELGIIPVFAAGNEGNLGNDSITYPANSFQVITIGATRKNQRAPFSSIGSDVSMKPDFMAPGYRLLSLKQGIGGPVYGRMSGTSMSAPLVSGLVAVLRQIDPFIGFSEIYRILESSTKDIGGEGWDPETGWGSLNFPEAVKVARDYLSDKISHGGKDTFKYYGHFTRSFNKTRDTYYRQKMIDLELSYMNFLDRQLKSETRVILTRWLKALSDSVKSNPRVFSDLNLRVTKRLKFLNVYREVN